LIFHGEKKCFAKLTELKGPLRGIVAKLGRNDEISAQLCAKPLLTETTPQESIIKEHNFCELLHIYFFAARARWNALIPWDATHNPGRQSERAAREIFKLPRTRSALGKVIS
jgi:hypothetical protein